MTNAAPGPFADFRAPTPRSVDISDADLDAALAVAHRACDAARAEILPRYGRVAVETKGDGSPVTEADREAEQAIRRVIADAFPGDAVLGEEFGEEAGVTSRRRWIVDPIDGTIAFTRGIPLFTTLIALLVDDEPVVGVIDLPAVDDRIGGSARRRTRVGWRGARASSARRGIRGTALRRRLGLSRRPVLLRARPAYVRSTTR